MRAISRHAMLGIALVLLFGGGACVTSRGPTKVTQHMAGSAATYIEAPDDGTYELFSTSLGGGRKAVYDLAKGDHLGFRPGDNGKIIAVAGPDEIELLDGNYYWQKR